jgi:hypothetical protein
MARGRSHLGFETERRDIPGEVIGRSLAVAGEGCLRRNRLDAEQCEQPLEAVVEIGVDVI